MKDENINLSNLIILFKIQATLKRSIKSKEKFNIIIKSK